MRRQLGRVDFVECVQRMGAGDNDDQVFHEQRFGDHVLGMHGHVHHGEVEPPGEELGEQRRGGGIDDGEVDAGMGPHHFGDDEWDEPPGGRADHAEADRAGHRRGVRREVVDQGVEFGLDAARPGSDQFPALGEGAVTPVDEFDSELGLEPCHVGGDVGLHGVQAACGSGEALVVADREERRELAKVHLWKR